MQTSSTYVQVSLERILNVEPSEFKSYSTEESERLTSKSNLADREQTG